MAIPDQVRRQAERANELLSQANGPSGEPEEIPPAPPESPPEEVKPIEPAAPTPPPPAEPAEPPQDPEPVPAAENWEHKYKTLQGVFNAETGRLHAELKVYKDRATALEQAAAQPAAPPAPAPTPAPLVTDKDVETYGPELMDVIGRKAQEIADGIVAKRLEELKPTLEQTNERIGKAEAQVYQTAQDRFFGELAKAVPDYKQVNGDPKWLAWLQEVDPLSGVQRQAYLDTAAGSLDHARVATLFTAFKKAAGVEAPPAEPSPASAPTPGTPPLSPSPRAVGVAVAQTPREPDNSVSRSEIDAHYKRSSLDPSYRKSPEHQAMEARIAAAMASGRIR